MAKDEAYQNAEKKIEAARKSGATELDLSVEWGDQKTPKLTELPESLGQLTRLRILAFRPGNYAVDVPDEIENTNWHGGAQEILQYYFSTRGTQGRALRELKLIVVGRGGAE